MKGVAQMGMERRQNRHYYYRKRRVGRRVVSEYIGAGELGELAYTLDRIEQTERIAERQAARAAERQALAEFQAQLSDPPALTDYLTLVRLLTDSTLVTEGLHQHRRGSWRRRSRGHD